MPRRRFSATVEIRTRNSQVIYSALKPDINHAVEGHTSADMKLVDDTILIDINSGDLSHLRASLNSYLRLAKTAVSCLDVTL
ncbi:MAG: KEOPS complex subunit Pcc1 [Nitrososphaerales archaeon]